MTRELTLLLALIAIGAGWLFLHIVLLVRSLRAVTLSRRVRMLAWLPPATPIIGWLGGRRALSVLWAAHALLYVWLRSLA